MSAGEGGRARAGLRGAQGWTGSEWDGGVLLEGRTRRLVLAGQLEAPGGNRSARTPGGRGLESGVEAVLGVGGEGPGGGARGL